MEEKLTACRESTLRLANKLNNFFYSDYYLLYVSLFTALFYCADLAFIGLASFALLACFLLIVYKDLTPFIPVPLFVVMIFRSFSIFNNPTTYLIFIPVVISFIAHFVLYPVKFFKGELFIPFILVTIALFAGGLFSEHQQYFLRGLVSTATVGPVIFIAYLLFSNYISPPKDFNLHKYIFTVLALMGLTCFIEVFAHNNIYVTLDINLWPTLGWGNINAAAAVMLFSIPSCCYLILYEKNTLPNLILLVILYATVFMTKSDGVGGVALSFIPIIMIAVITHGKLKASKHHVFKAFFFICCCLAIIAVVSIVAFNKHVELLEMLWLELSNDTNRTFLYGQAMSLFKKYPIFGVGQGFVPEDPIMPLSPVVTYNFHSTLFHVLATMGLVGLVAYVYYFAKRYKIITKVDCPFNLFVFFAFTMFEIYAMVDTGEFNVIPLLLAITVMLAVTEYSNNHVRKEILPLKMNVKISKLLFFYYKDFPTTISKKI